ncbi:MAG: iron(III) transport system substrate-binding protein [Variibacter sp.]|nr:iron(III) transport system substrate-binding protein [Variibacter sp.]
MRGCFQTVCVALTCLFAGLGSPASAQSEIVVYTAYETEDLAPYKAAFEKDNPGQSLRWVHDANGVITARLLAEKSSPRADAVWGVGASSMGLLAERGVLQPYVSPDVSKIGKKFRDHAEPATWFGNSAWVAAIIFNTAEGERLRIPKPETWKDLTKEIYRGKIVMPHPASSGTGFLYVSAWLQTYGEEEGWKFMDGLHANIWRYTHSGSQPATLAARGEAVVGIAFDLRGSREKDRGAPIDLVFPKEGLGWEMNAFGIVAGGPNPGGAQKLAAWAASDAAMRLYGATRAVAARPEFAKPIAHLPANLHEMLIDNDFAWAALNRERILAEWSRRYDGKADPKKQ